MVRVETQLRTLIVCCLAATQALAATPNGKTQVIHPSAFGISQRISDLPIDLSSFPGREMPEPSASHLRDMHPAPGPWQDPALQTEVLPPVGATQGVSFDGISTSGWIPPDNNLAVSPTIIGVTVNTDVAFYSKTGALLSGPTNIPLLFTAVGGLCTIYVVDPIVLYDRPADRWVVAGIGLDYNGNYSECIGVSTTNDPTASYATYIYPFGTTLNDYDKLSVWATASNSAYLATYNLFPPTGAGSADLCGFDRAKMLVGNAGAAMLCQKTSSSESSYLPSDMDGPTPPVDGTPGLFLNWQNSNPGKLNLRKLTLNFASGTATLSAPTAITVANDTLACGSGGACVPQPGTGQKLDTLGDRMMYRFAIRHFADHDRAVTSHAVGSSGSVAVRWYELYDPAGTVTLNQQGTFAPDSTYRWMSSIAEDQNANIGLGYSASSSTVNPAVRFTGRVPSDPAGTMETEASIIEGGGVQTGGSSADRWGDYTAMQVDPSDDCTFWYVNEYQTVTGYENWTTRIASFAFPGCGGGGGPVMSLDPTSLKFGKVLVGVTKGKKKVTATNTGSSVLTISNIATTGDFALVTVKATKKVTPCANGTNLAPGASCLIKVSFTPTQTGARTGSVNFTDNAPGSPQSVSLAGTGK